MTDTAPERMAPGTAQYEPTARPANPLADGLADVFRQTLLAGGIVTDPYDRELLAETYVANVVASTAVWAHVQIAPTPEVLTNDVADLLAAGWMLLRRESSTRALLIRARSNDPARQTQVLAALDDTCSALESLVDFTDRHRVTYPTHDHDCYERWKIEQEYARRTIDAGNRARRREATS